MRRYHGGDHRILRDGSIEIDGAWTGVQPIALGLAVGLALLLFLQNRVLLVGGVVFAFYLLVLPTRRRVKFDASGRVLRIDHAGPFRERSRRAIPFEDLRAIYFAAAGRRGGRAMRSAIARTRQGDVYLLTVPDTANRSSLEASIAAILAEQGRS